MHLNKTDLQSLCEIAKTAALRAGAFIASHQGKKITVNSKEGGENIASCVVTEIDIQAQAIILEELTPTLKKYELGLLTEESVDDDTRHTNDYFWCIDPLDGTLAFSQDQDGYSTSIALIDKNGVPIIGAVYNPRTKCLYHAIKGQGAFKNQQPLKIKSDGRDLTLLYDQSYKKHPEYQKQVCKLEEDLKILGLNRLNIHHLGGAVMNGISTIDMAPAIYFKFPKRALGGGSLWDFAASSIIQSEAGGFNSDYYQCPLDLNRTDSTFMNHKGVIYTSNTNLLKLIPKIE